tara:strand:- start:991 stop:1137 length:147 start_codon:yes stop_codon:yes gene_type:complete
MAKKKSQFSTYKKWKSDEGYTFMARDKEDAKLYLKKIGSKGKLTEVND